MLTRSIVNLCIALCLMSCQTRTAAEDDFVDQLTINQLQFVGSHNSYKLMMSDEFKATLEQSNPTAARALEYAHIPLSEQLDLGIRKLELDIFVGEDLASFAVGHVQLIDMNSHCASLSLCLSRIRQWSDAHPQHVPLWISFNAKDTPIDGLPKPLPFTSQTFLQLDQVLEANLGDRLIRPRDIVDLNWPRLADARGKIIFILDEQSPKREMYLQGWRERPMFANVSADHPAAAIMIVNDPVADQSKIRNLVEQGFMVRTRADADTVEARQGDTRRRDAAFVSGAQAVSTDYYLPTNPFDTDYVVKLPGGIRCNPVSAPRACVVQE